MEMKQMVYVVTDNGSVTGVYNEYEDAVEHTTDYSLMTPVVVDHYRDERDWCDNGNEVVMAMENELKSLTVLTDYEEYEDDDEEDKGTEEEMIRIFLEWGN